MPRVRNKSVTRAKWTIRFSSPSHDNKVKGRTIVYLGVGSEYQNVSLIQEFKAMVPPIFQGGPNFLKIENLLKDIKKILDAMAILKAMRVSLASFMLRDEVDDWWDMIKTTHDVTQMTGIQFKELFLSICS